MNTVGDVLKVRKNAKSEIEKLKGMITEKKLVIGRLPNDTKCEFTSFAKEKYCDDFGMAFKAVWEYYKGDIKYIDILERITTLEDAFNEFFNEPEMENKEEPGIKTLSGKLIGEIKNEK